MNMLQIVLKVHSDEGSMAILIMLDLSAGFHVNDTQYYCLEFPFGINDFLVMDKKVPNVCLHFGV